jgi:hypothetical protein
MRDGRNGHPSGEAGMSTDEEKDAAKEQESKAKDDTKEARKAGELSEKKRPGELSEKKSGELSEK